MVFPPILTSLPLVSSDVPVVSYDAFCPSVAALKFSGALAVPTVPALMSLMLLASLLFL
jgi:hypothetical protein